MEPPERLANVSVGPEIDTAFGFVLGSDEIRR
jgi:hypothetical protein